LDTREETAQKILVRYASILEKEYLEVSEISKNEYSYQVSINDGKDKILLHVFFGKKGNKILLQGNKELKLYKKVNEFIFGETLIPDDNTELEPSYPYIGTDESGKGDYFGPLVVAGVYTTPAVVSELTKLGIRDSKELSDNQIINFASQLKKMNQIAFDVVQISPEKYNTLYEKFGNLNRMMGWAHARVIENLLSKCDAGEVISDKFGNDKLILDALQEKGRTVKLTQVTKAERFTAVAAASIMARESVVKWFNSQSKKYKLDIPKGSSTDVEKFAKRFLEKYGEEVLKKMVKHHFKTSNRVFN
jgi:ribonuclease HIII